MTAQFRKIPPLYSYSPSDEQVNEHTAMAEDIDFDVELYEQGDEGGAYRTQNKPSGEIQRVIITERRGATDIRCTHKDVIHGYLENGEGPATLIVYEFQFDQRKKARRICRVDIEFYYSGPGSGPDSGPEVLKIAPLGRMSIEPTTLTEKITESRELKTVGLGGSYKWTTESNRETKDAMIVVGSPILLKRNYGSPNGVSWTLMENEITLTGVPAFFQAAVLLKQDRGTPSFKGTLKVNAKLDISGSLKALVGSKPKDDPVFYDPESAPTNQLCDYDTKNLEPIDLQKLVVASFTTPTKGDVGSSLCGGCGGQN
jgi:hypothetical protein